MFIHRTKQYRFATGINTRQRGAPRMNKKLLWLAIAFFVVAIISRFVPHLPNATAIGALALFSGTYLKKWWRFALPLGAMFVSDAAIGLYDVRIMAVVYAGFLVNVMIGIWLKHNKSPACRQAGALTIFSGTLGGSLFFFFSTNTAVWAFGTWYPHTASGLWLSLVMAIPFWRNMLIGDILYVALFFSTYALVSRLEKTFSLGRKTTARTALS